MKLRLDKKTIAFYGAFFLLAALLIVLPTGFQKAIYVNATASRARVLSTDDSAIFNTGLFRQGDQRCYVEVLAGEHKGYRGDGVNLLSGSLASDKVFKAGDIAWVLIERDKEDNVVFINMVDFYRLGKELLFAFVFALALLLFAPRSGGRMIMSFAFAFLCLWKLLVPLALKGYNPLLISAGTLLLIISSTLPLVSGLNIRTLASIIGSIISLTLALGISVFATCYFKIHGAVLEMSESLLYCGFENLDLTSLFAGVVCLSAGGAIMDLSIDVSAAIQEVSMHSQSISRGELFKSGMAVGRAGVGTQITTLLLAYMGNYLTVMMVYMAQSTPPLNILTSQIIASEIVQTGVGCFSLILVTPITAFIASLLFSRKKNVM